MRQKILYVTLRGRENDNTVIEILRERGTDFEVTVEVKPEVWKNFDLVVIEIKKTEPHVESTREQAVSKHGREVKIICVSLSNNIRFGVANSITTLEPDEVKRFLAKYISTALDPTK